jgi:hypothetical protein
VSRPTILVLLQVSCVVVVVVVVIQDLDLPQRMVLLRVLNDMKFVFDIIT